MKLVTAGVAAAFALIALNAYAQDDKEALKKRILEAVEKKLKAEEERILKEIEKIIDEELAKAKGVKPSKTDPKPDPDKPKPDPDKPKPDPAKPKARGYLGIVPSELSADELKDLGIKGGVRIGQLTEDGPGAKSGLKEEDVILSVDGQEVAESRALPGIIQKKGAGTEVTIKILRDKKEMEIKVKLGRHPQDGPEEDPPKADPPKKDDPKAPEPKSEGDLRERIKKFLDKEKKDEPKKDDPKKAEPGDEGGLSLDDSLVEKMRGLLEPLGADVDTYLEKGKDGRWRLKEEYREMFKGLSPGELFKKITGEAGKEAKKDEPKPEARKADAKPASKKGGAAWLGVMPEELTDDVRAQLDIEEGVGLSVAETRSGSPAEKLLKKGDIIVKIDGKPLKGEEGLKKFVASAKPGQECELTVLRKGKQETVKVTLAERKD